MSIGEYHSYKTTAFLEVEKAFRRLAAQHDLVVLEGAGSIAEPDSTEPSFNLQEELDRLADHLEKHLDLGCIEKMLNLSATEDKAWTG